MGKCNNCTKFLTCNRTECKQVTYLQANQIEKIETKKEIELSIEAACRRLTEAMLKLGATFNEPLNSSTQKKEKEKKDG